MEYQVWLFDSGEKAAYLDKAFNVVRKQVLNEAPTLSFSLPANDSKTVYLTSGYTVKIYNTEAGAFEGLYDISSTTMEWNDGGSVYSVECVGILARLAKSDNISYDSTSTPQSPETIISGLLALQDAEDPISLGTIEPTTAFSLSIENDNILKAILECVSYLGGYVEVDSSGALNWYNTPSGTITTEIRYKKNLRGITREIDYSGIYNRIYAYGHGEGEAQVTLVDAGVPAGYVEDAASQTAYGLSIRRITDKRIRHPATLNRWANTVLSELKDPRYSYSVDVINLAVHDDYSYDFELLQIADVIRIVNDDISISVDVVVVSTTENLSEPHKISIELDNIIRDLSDTFAAIRDSTHVSENQDVQIGAGQVTVQGTFTVDGWRSAGTTTIDGGNITANTISVNKLSFTPVESGNIVGTINASTEGIRIDANKITISGDTYFVSSDYDPTNKINEGGAAADVNGNLTRINGGKIHTRSLFADRIVSRNITANEIQVGAITATEIASYTITATEIAANAITASKIQAGSISTDKLNFTPVTGDNVVASINSSSEGITIQANKITINGTIGYGNALYSPNYGPSTGWRIDGYGNAEFNTINIRGNIRSGGLTAVSYGAARLHIFENMETALHITDYYGNTTFKTYVGIGSTWGNVVIGRYESGGNGCLWNNSAATFTIRGTLGTTRLDTGNKLTVYGDIESQNFDVGSGTGWRISGDGGVTASDIVAMGDIICDRLDSSMLVLPNSARAANGSIWAASSGSNYWIGVYLNGGWRYVNLY